MEQFYFERPSIEKKDEIIDFLNEFKEYNSNIHGSGALNKIFNGYSFEEALEMTLNMENDEYARSINRATGKTLLFIRESDKKIIGVLNLRWNLPPNMFEFGGHIGYSIRPTERRKGYNKIQLYMGLIEAKKIGLDRVMLDCNINNIGSDKTLKALGGVLERTGIDPSDGNLTNVYWFNVAECTHKYKEQYQDCILDKIINR